MKIFAKEIFKEVRIKKGFSLVALSELVDLSKQAIGQIEKRTNGVSPEKSQTILKVLGVEFDDVFELVDRGE